jgi:hypothetical protein
MDKTQLFPGGCMGFCRPTHFKPIPASIMLYANWWEHIPKEYRVSHAFTLWKKNIIHESNLAGNQPREIAKYLNHDFEFWLFRNDQMTEKQYNAGRAYSQARIGLPYDIPGFFKFLIKVIPQLKWADFCSEYQALNAREGLSLPWVPGIAKPSKISPSKAFMWATTAEAKAAGWNLLFYWNGKELLNEYIVR